MRCRNEFSRTRIGEIIAEIYSLYIGVGIEMLKRVPKDWDYRTKTEGKEHKYKNQFLFIIAIELAQPKVIYGASMEYL